MRPRATWSGQPWLLLCTGLMVWQGIRSIPDTFTEKVSTLQLDFSEEDVTANDPFISQFSTEAPETSVVGPEADSEERTEAPAPSFSLSEADELLADEAGSPVIFGINDDTWFNRLIPDSYYSFSVDAPPLLVSQILFGVWIFISSLLLCRLFLSGLLVFKLKREVSVAPPGVEHVTQHWLGATKSPRHVEVGISHSVRSAVAVGYLHPMVLIPQKMLNALEHEEMEQVILHELAHIRRFDDWTILAQQMARVLLFFHPGIWILSRLMNQDREIACDDWVVSLSKQPKKYASCLAKVAALNIPGYSPVAVAPATSSKKQLFVRVRSILNKRLSDSYRTSRIVFVSMFVIALGIFLGVSYWAPMIAFAEKDIEPLQPVEDLFTAEIADAEAADVLTVLDTGAGDYDPDDSRPVEQIDMEEKGLSIEAIGELSVAEPIAPESEIIGEIGFVNPDIDAQLAPASLDTNETLNALYPVRLEDSELIKVEDRSLLNLLNLYPLTSTDRDVQRIMEDSQKEESSDLRNVLPEPSEQKSPSVTGKRTPLSKRSMIRWLEAVKRMPSPGEKKSLLEKATFQLPADDEVHIAFMEAAKTLSSPKYRTGLMVLMLGRSELSKEGVLRYLEMAKSLPSSDDRYGLLSSFLVSEEKVFLRDEQVQRLFKSGMETITKNMHYQAVAGLYLHVERELNEKQ